MADYEKLSENAAKTLLNAGVTMASINEKDELLYAIVPDGCHLETEDIADRQEQREPAPRRIKGTVSLANVDSFLAFTEREFVKGTTVCFADLSGSSFKTIFNYAAPGGVPGWGDRIAVLELTKTSNWKRWINNDGKAMGQLNFADFLEANMEDIVEPDAASIIEMVSALKVKKKAEFHSVVDQKTGFSTLQFSEEIKGESTKGQVDFFGKFTIGIAPFYGSDAYKVSCNLRFSITDEGKLFIYYKMINPEAIVEDAFNVERSKILEKMDDMQIPVFDH